MSISFFPQKFQYINFMLKIYSSLRGLGKKKSMTTCSEQRSLEVFRLLRVSCWGAAGTGWADVEQQYTDPPA